jgi:hypothetical protein
MPGPGFKDIYKLQKHPPVQPQLIERTWIPAMFAAARRRGSNRKAHFPA